MNIYSQTTIYIYIWKKNINFKRHCVDSFTVRKYNLLCKFMCVYNKKTTRVPVLSHQTTRVKTYHLSAKREGDEFFTEGSLVNENSNEGGFLFIMNLKI